MAGELYDLYRKCFPHIPVPFDAFCESLQARTCDALLCRVGGELAGAALLGPSSLALLCVAPSHRGKGIGSGLLEAAEGMLRKAGREKIILGKGESYLFQGVPFCGQADPRGFFEKKGYQAQWSSADLTLRTESLGSSKVQELWGLLPAAPPEVSFRLARTEDEEALLQAVGRVDAGWVRFYEGTKDPVMLACRREEIVGFLLADPEANAIFARDGEQMGAIGCVGVVPEARERGTGLRLVKEATCFLAEKGCGEIHIGYTHLAHWYARLGYQVRMEFWMGEKKL